MQVPKKNPLMRVGEFEKHTKGFGSKYMSKFGFGKGTGLGRNEQGTLLTHANVLFQGSPGA